MKTGPKRIPKAKNIENLEINIKGQKFNLGKLMITTTSRCPVRKTYNTTYLCINTRKTFTNIDKACKHLAEYLVDSGKVILTK